MFLKEKEVIQLKESYNKERSHQLENLTKRESDLMKQFHLHLGNTKKYFSDKINRIEEQNLEV